MCPPRESELGCPDVVRRLQKSHNHCHFAEQFRPLKGFARQHVGPSWILTRSGSADKSRNYPLSLKAFLRLCFLVGAIEAGGASPHQAEL